jgi:hypothetical protein
MFLRFVNTAERDAFIENARRQEPQVLPRIRVSKTQPNVVTIRSATPSETRSLARMAGSKAQVYDDIQFETFDPR